MSSDKKGRVVVVGGGFAGLRVVKGLAKADVEIDLVDSRNHHLFQPLLYQVATAGLSPSDIAQPIRSILRRQKNVRTIMDEVIGVDLQQQVARTREGELPFDWLVVATGMENSYFGREEWSRRAPGLKSVEDALEIRKRILSAFEAAESRPEEKSSQLTFVVIGGGPTGVELAGAIAEIAHHAMRRDFRRMKPEEAKIILLEGGDAILPSYPEPLCESAQRQLEQLGVEVRVGARVDDITDSGVSLQSGEKIDSRTVVWAAGVRGSGLGKELGAPTDRSGRVQVEPDLSLPEHRNVFVAGDLAHVEADGDTVPGVAPAAMQAGTHVAKCIEADLDGRERPRFLYRDKGSMATIGRARAVAQVGRFELSGLVAWMAWLLVHIYFLVGFRNRVFVMLGWAWNYITFRRGARLITHSGTRS